MKTKTELTLTRDDQKRLIITGLRDGDLRLPQSSTDIDIKWVKGGDAVVSFTSGDDPATNPPGRTTGL